MMRIYRLIPCMALACLFPASSLFAQAKSKPAAPPADAKPAEAPASQPAAEIPLNQGLKEDVEDFWHYGKIARYDMAVAYGNKILSRPEPPLEILHMFETTADSLRTPAEGQLGGLDDWMLRWRGLEEPAMRDVANKIEALLDKGRYAKRTDPKFIIENIERLSVNSRGYANGLAQLRNSGELAVPLMVDYLRDPNKAAFQEAIRNALQDMGIQALNPLLAAMEMNDNSTLLTLMSIVSNIGHQTEGVPYLARIAQDNNRPGPTRQAAAVALQRMGASVGNIPVSDLFFRLAVSYYYGRAGITPDPKADSAYIWSWTDHGLDYKAVPPVVFNDLMSMRECRHAMELSSGTGDALSLYLSANTRLEVDLPDGANITVFAANRPTSDYYNASAGAQYLNAVLTRNLNDHNAAVALKVIKSLAQIVGPSSQGAGAQIDPLVQAMRYPDRLVRFEAAFALAGGLPTRSFAGHDMVAPLLAEAVAQTGSSNILIVASAADVARLSNDLKPFNTAGGATAQQALAEATSLPWVDVILVVEDVGDAQIDQVYKIAGENARLERSAKVIIAKTRASNWFGRAATDPLTVATTATDAAGIQKAIADARQKAGGLAMDEKIATSYATRAAGLLQRIAEGRVQTYDLSPVQSQLLTALNDPRPEIVKLIADTVAYIDGSSVQSSLAVRALDDKSADDIKIAAFKGLAKNAKLFGNHLGQQVSDLQKAVETAQNLDVRTAAAEAHGALNLSADQVKTLIIKESKP